MRQYVMKFEFSLKIRPIEMNCACKYTMNKITNEKKKITASLKPQYQDPYSDFHDFCYHKWVIRMICIESAFEVEMCIWSKNAHSNGNLWVFEMRTWTKIYIFNGSLSSLLNKLYANNKKFTPILIWFTTWMRKT